LQYAGWRIVYSFQEDDSNHGLWYLILENNDDIIVVFRGTPPPGDSGSLNLPDWYDTLGSIFTGTHRQTSLAENEALRGNISNYITGRNNVYITGHSLGGHLSMEIFRQIAFAGRSGRIQRIETFNPVGIRSAHAANIRSGAMTHHQICCDLAKIASNIRGLQFSGAPNSLNRVPIRGCVHIVPSRDARWWENVLSSANLAINILEPSFIGLGAIAWQMIDAHAMKNFDHHSIHQGRIITPGIALG
jgi:hypothetical protein